ncbi:hypothetical protein CASFOL_016615 [Castilleja foliolosa]|uniref:Beta-glucosidase n=1 Tax=Castilleja foliolosa TaxID=1961234 RepID=A0ABD3D942_9LAMI
MMMDEDMYVLSPNGSLLFEPLAKPLSSMPPKCSDFIKDGVPIGESTGSSWLYIVPWGFNSLLKFINDKFNTLNNLPPIYITENGCDQQNDPMQAPYQACKDHQRVGYFKDHLAFLLKTIKEENMKIESYFAWSFCDNIEWYDGYRSRFGIYYIDFKNDLKQHAKDSSMWFARFLLKKIEQEENTEDNTVA